MALMGPILVEKLKSVRKFFPVKACLVISEKVAKQTRTTGAASFLANALDGELCNNS